MTNANKSDFKSYYPRINLTERYDDLDAAAREKLGLFYCPHCGTRIIGTIFDK